MMRLHTGSRIKAIIFDLDGTLIDSSEGIVEAFNFALRQFNLPEQPPSRIASMIGFPLDQMFQELAGNSNPELQIAFRNKGRETVAKASQPLEGVNEVVASLFDSGYKLGIATTKSRQNIDAILEKMGWWEFFMAVIGGNEVSQVKPHPEQFEWLLGKMNSDCTNTAVVGDTINDILPARQLGLTEIAVRSPYGSSLQVQQLGPHFFLEDLSELADVLGVLNRRGQ